MHDTPPSSAEEDEIDRQIQIEAMKTQLDFPDDPVPAHEPLPFDHHRHLPERPAF